MNYRLEYALSKYDDVQYSIIAICPDEEYALNLERQLRPTENIGWNIAPGGGMPPGRDISGANNPMRDPEVRQKQANSKRGQSLSAEHSAAISASLKGENSQWFGKKFSDEHRKNLSIAHIGQVVVHSDETKAKLSAGKMGDLNPMKDPKWQMTCEHCGKTTNKAAHNHWHGDRCKYRNKT